MNYFKNKVNQIFLVIFVLVFGLGFGQFPQFLAQYLQRLGGHIDEAKMVSAQFDVEELQQRAITLEESLESIQNAPILLKLPVFLQKADWDIVDRALENYRMGMTFDRIGLWYCISGAIIGILLFDLSKGLFNLLFRRKRKRGKKEDIPESEVS